MFRRISEALDNVAAEVRGLRNVALGLSESFQTPERVAELEGQVGAVVNEARALIQNAESRFAAARASEERNRHQIKRLEKLREFDEDDPEGPDPFEQYARALAEEGNGMGGGEEGLPPVHPGLEAVSGKAAAHAAKWGR